MRAGRNRPRRSGRRSSASFAPNRCRRSGCRGPTRRRIAAAAAALETALDRAALASPNPGSPAIHRLNRAEYTNAIRDLLALDIDGRSLLPPDDCGVRLRQHRRQPHGLAAPDGALSGRGPPDRPAGVRLPRERSGGARSTRSPSSTCRTSASRRTLPFGTRGGLAVTHYFPLDGEYTFQVKLERNHSEVLRGMTDKSQLEIRVDGQRMKVFTVGGLGKRPACYVTNTCPENPDDKNQADDGLDVRLPLKAGYAPDRRRRSSTSSGPSPRARSDIERRSGSSTARTSAARWSTRSRLADRSTATVPADTPSRRAIFVCRPKGSADETACANRDHVAAGAPRFRRPVTKAGRGPADARVQRGRAAARRSTSASSAALRAILVDPGVPVPHRARSGERQAGSTPTASATSSWPRASRSSCGAAFPTMSSLDAGRAGQAEEPAVLAQQVSPDARATRGRRLWSENFGGQWLLTRNVGWRRPNPDEFSAWDENLREAFERETELFFESMLARGPQRPRPADRRLHVPQRAAREVLRHPRVSTAGTSGA